MTNDLVRQIGNITWRRKPQSKNGQFHLTAEATNGLAHIRAEWHVAENASGMDPETVRVRRMKRNTDTARGVTVTVMRDAEALLTTMREGMGALVAGDSLPDPMERIHLMARQLPDKPSRTPNYGRMLLDLYAAIEATGTRNPVKTLVEVTGRPEGTIKLHLRKARAAATTTT